MVKQEQIKIARVKVVGIVFIVISGNELHPYSE